VYISEIWPKTQRGVLAVCRPKSGQKSLVGPLSGTSFSLCTCMRAAGQMFTPMGDRYGCDRFLLAVACSSPCSHGWSPPDNCYAFLCYIHTPNVYLVLKLCQLSQSVVLQMHFDIRFDFLNQQACMLYCSNNI
jgi:hypothetical protein